MLADLQINFRSVWAPSLVVQPSHKAPTEENKLFIKVISVMHRFPV